MTGLSTAAPKLTVSAGAGLMAVISLGPLTADGHVTETAKGVSAVAAETSTAPNARDEYSIASEVQSARADVSYPASEEWDEKRHNPELRRLIVKKATSRNRLAASEEARLTTLQRMRRESLPLATSYDEFIRERERIDELMRLTDALLAYERKYGSAAND